MSLRLQARKVVSVNTADVGSGAERVAWDLFQAFKQRGLDSWLVVGDKRSDDPGVIPFSSSPFMDYRSFTGDALQRKLQESKARNAARGLEDFEHTYSKHLLAITGSRPDAVVLHNLHGDYFDLRVLPSISEQVPVFWMLHDAWSFSGHCAYHLDCERWQTGCGQCPYLQSPPAVMRDATAENWERKRRIFEESQLYVTAPTNWLLDEAKHSILSEGLMEARHIPCPVNVSRFQPADRAAVRLKLGLPVDVSILLFAAHRARSNPYKDYETIRAAIQRLAQRLPDEPIVCLVLGERAAEERLEKTRILSLPFQPQNKMPQYLQAADIYLHAAKAENFGLVTAEAQACGTPVVATAVGGLPEIVADGERGLLVRPGDPDQMADAIHRLLTDGAYRLRLGDQAVRYARAHWAEEVVASRFLNWFEEVLMSKQETSAPGTQGSASRSNSASRSHSVSGKALSLNRTSQAGLQDSRRALFLHIPKTAGTSLKQHLFHRYAADDCLMDPGGKALLEADFEQYSLVAGHLDFDYVSRYRVPPLVLVCLRQPVERALSAYYYQKLPRLAIQIRQSAAALGAETAKQVLESLRRLNRYESLAEFLRGEPAQAKRDLGDVQTQFVAGAAASYRYSDNPARLLNIARKNLEACAGIFLTERLSETFSEFSRQIGWENLSDVPRENSTGQRLRADEHNPEVLAALAELAPLDMELYRFAEELLEQRRPVEPAASKFKLEPLPSAREFRFDQPIRGAGWYMRERGSDGWFCWMGIQAELHLKLVTRGPHFLSLQVEHAASSLAWKGLEVKINDEPVSLIRQSRKTPATVSANVPAHLLDRSPGHVRVGLKVPQTVCPCEADSCNPDSRNLGIALSRLQLQPL